jgi:cell division protein FtsW (lipid II flippase)
MLFHRNTEDDTSTFDDLDFPEDDGAYTSEDEPLEPVAIDHSDRYIAVCIIFEIAFAAMVWYRSAAAGKNYLIALAPMILATGIIGNRAYQHSADMKLFTAMAVLASMGIGLQLIIDQVYTTSSTFNLLKYIIGLFVAVIFILFYNLFRKILNSRATVYIMMIATAAIYFILYRYGYDPNGYGTNAWIQFHGLTIELTDFTKVTALLFYAALFSSAYQYDEKKVLINATIFFGLNLIGSVLIHELGSFFILFFLHLSILYIYLDHSRRKRIYLMTIFLLCVLGVAVAFALYKLLLPSYEAGTMNSLTSFIWPFVRKIYERFSLTASINNDPYGSGYQLLQGKKAMWMGGLLGNTVHFTAIPVAESDMAFIVLVNECGWPIAFLALIELSRIAMHGGRLARRLLKKDRQDSLIAFGAAAMLYLQGMIVILGSCNLIPFTGLPIPFLSRGFTYQTIVLCFCGILIHLSEERKEDEDAVSSEEENAGE